MATKQTRTKAHRRDRRRAKASNWTRQGKCNMGKRIGHGPGVAPQINIQTTKTSKKSVYLKNAPEPSLSVPMGKVVDMPNIEIEEKEYGWDQFEVDFKYDLENGGSQEKPR